MSDWKPNDFHADPMVNAVLNVACSVSALATATHELLYALKYSRVDGLSVAEAIEVGAKEIASAVHSIDTGGGNG